ncbi:MAG: hypothetical protein V1493_01095 [Candidatus Diapherotrites archaeon]
MDYDDVRRAFRLEKNSSQLCVLEADFWPSLKDFMKKERERYVEDLKSGHISKAKDFANLEQIVLEFLAIREKKVLNKALVASRTNEFSLDGLTHGEKGLFNGLLDVLEKFRMDSSDLFGAKAGKERTEEKDLKKLPLQVLSDIPSFIGADMKEYGPFSKGQCVELPGKTAELLVERKLAVKND